MNTSKYPQLHKLHASPVRGPQDALETDTQLILSLPKDEDIYFSSRVDHEGGVRPMVRVMRSSPEHMSVQIRTYGPVTGARNGKTRAVYSQFSSNRQNMLKIAEEIRRVALLLPEA